MRLRERLRPSPATVIGSLAILVTLTGTGITAVSQALPRGSVGTAQLKANAVTSAKVRNGSLLQADFAAGQIPAGAPGPAGRAGPQGAKGDKGATGDSGLVGTIIVRERSIVVPGGGGESGNYDSENARPACNADERAISGGTGWRSTDADDRELWTGYMRLMPGATANEFIGFMGKGGNDSGLASSFVVYVLCYKR